MIQRQSLLLVYIFVVLSAFSNAPCSAQPMTSTAFSEWEISYQAINEMNEKQIHLRTDSGQIKKQHNVELQDLQADIEKKERELAALKSDEVEKNTKILKQKMYIILIVGLCAIGIIIFFLQWRSVQKLNQINNSLQEKNVAFEEQDEKLRDQNALLIKHNKKLSEMNAEQNSIMEILVHDLKSPLNRIGALLDAFMVKAAGKLTEEEKEILNKVEKVRSGSVKLIRDILAVSALETNIEFHLAPHELGRLLEESIASVQERAIEKNISIKFDKLSEDVVVTTDEYYLSRIIDNLLSNAIKFSKGGTRVRVRYGRNDGNWFFSISDQGPGFTDEDRLSMYEKYRRLSARPTGNETSNGLGLAIVKLLTDKMSGMIELDTAPNAGASFTISFVDM